MSKRIWITHTTWCATARAETDTLDNVKKGEGKIVRLHGRKVAAYRDDAGHVTVCSPSARICTVWSAGTRPITSGLSLPRLALPRDRCRAAWAGGGTSGASRPCRASGMTGRTCTLRTPCKGSACPARWGAGGVSRYRSPVATPQHWLRRGAFPHCFGVHLLHRARHPRGRRARRTGAARQSLQPAGRACDRRHVGGAARSPAARSQNESGAPIILRAGLRWR